MDKRADVTVDVAIVGGGIAGAALATVLARDGYEVLLLERQTSYRDKVRGEFLSCWGVAEMLASLLAYARGAGVDTRWLVIGGGPEFFRVTKRLHNAVHEAVGSEAPRGYDHQISAGGEPTARYTIARHKLVYADPTGRVDVKTTVQGSVGFLTETSAAVSVRVGSFDTPWWSFAPEMSDYIAAPTPVESLGVQREAYVFAGARIKARAYNALLQGQFRHSDVRYSYDEIESIVAEAWIGVMTQLFSNTELSYALHYQTAELREGKAARDTFWGGVQLAHSF